MVTASGILQNISPFKEGCVIQYDGCHKWSRKCLPFRIIRVHLCFSGVRVGQFTFNVVSCRSLLAFCSFFPTIVCTSIYSCWLLLLYLQIFLVWSLVIFIFNIKFVLLITILTLTAIMSDFQYLPWTHIVMKGILF